MTGATRSVQSPVWAARGIALLGGIAIVAVVAVAAFVILSFPTPVKVKSLPPFNLWHPGDGIKAFNSAGLMVDKVTLRKDQIDGLTMGMMVEATAFAIPVQGAPSAARGILFCFQNEIDLQTMQSYYVSLGKALPQYSSWIFVKDNMLLQINGDVPEAVANRYARALNLLD